MQTHPLPSAQRAPARPIAALVRIGIACAAVLLTLWSQLAYPPQLSFFGNEWLRDMFVRMQATDAPDPRVLVVDIDEASIAAEGPWPWPRERLATLAEILITHYGARGVALDIVLPEPPDEADAQGDARLALMSRHGPLVLAQAFDYDFGESRPQALREGRPAGATGAYASGVPATGYIANHARLAAGAKVGNIGFVPDADGALRRVPLVTSFDGQHYPALALALVNCCSGAGAVPLTDTGLMRVAYRRDWTAYTVVSATDVLHQRIDPPSASGRLVLVGSSSLGLGDRVTTPFAASRPGLGVQATMLSTLLDQQAGLAPARWPGRALAILFATSSALIAFFAFPRVSALASTTLLGGSSLVWLVAAYAIAPHDPDMAVTGPLATNLFLLAFAVPYQWQQAQRRSRHLLDTLRQYVAPSVVEELLKSDLADPLQPRALDVTTLIADMEGYTSQVESLPLDQAARLTRDFLDCLTEPVFQHNGTLDKYTGDGLVAFWGAPLPLENHADMALDAARAISERVRVLSDARVAAGGMPLRVRIGIDSGPALAGDFGSALRSIYTAVGDSVNTASRLEQLAREFSHNIIVGTGTVQRARRHRFLHLGERLLRGKEKATELYTLAPRQAGVEDAAA